MTFGRIRSYSPEDGVIKTPITTLKGVIDKTTGEEPFITPDRVRKVYDARDFGRFVHPKLGKCLWPFCTIPTQRVATRVALY